MELKPIESAPSYFVSDDGRVFRELKQHPTEKGYMRVNIGRRPLRVSRLVAEAFIPNPGNKTFVSHVNRDKTDNRAENLIWTTPDQAFSIMAGEC